MFRPDCSASHPVAIPLVRGITPDGLCAAADRLFAMANAQPPTYHGLCYAAFLRTVGNALTFRAAQTDGDHDPADYPPVPEAERARVWVHPGFGRIYPTGLPVPKPAPAYRHPLGHIGRAELRAFRSDCE